jgi:hypothetical protein
MTEQDKYYQTEPKIKPADGMRALLSAFETCYLYNERGLEPRFVWNHAVMDFMTMWEENGEHFSDWQDAGLEYADLDHCLMSLAFAVTLSGIDADEVLR